jgi:LysM repeat protein
MSKRLPIAAAPALLGVAAAAALSLQAGPASASTITHHAATTSHHSNVTHVELTSYTATSSSSYTVESGDTLSSIAASVYGNSGDWSTIYDANSSEISDANLIYPGEVLSIPASGSDASSSESSSDSSSSDTASSDTASSDTSASTSTDSDSDSTSDESAFQQCVIETESGGDAQVMNSSGHYGLYQFSASTWAEYGGDPAEFGDATVAEQNQVFENAIAAGGESNWSAYDGC